MDESTLQEHMPIILIGEWRHLHAQQTVWPRKSIRPKRYSMNYTCRVGVFGLCLFYFSSMILNAQPVGKVKNNPPIVEILTPKDGGTFEWNTIMHYSIHITDDEDGNSVYQEIEPKEIFLEIKYIPGGLKIDEKTIRNKVKINRDPPGLAILKTSNCLNCHALKSNLVGPSFLQISQRYPLNATSVERLTGKVIRGSSGVWSTTAMAPHPELTKEQGRQLVQWILKNAKDPNLDYSVGTEGTFRIKPKPGNGEKGWYILTASYTDHGSKEQQQFRKSGRQSIILKSN
jgi:cytochrome c